MIYQYTGQPGHGKTLHAINRALEFQDDGRTVYVCNVRQFDYEKAGMKEMTPEQFKDWPNFLPEGSVALVDECYEHDMLAKLPPGAKVPEHIQQLAKHRHHGLDFIFVAQSPTKQMHQFTHDLIEQHTHVRRRFGTKFAHLRVFDRFEPRPEKAHPMVLKRVKLPTRPFGLYQSTELDTTETKVPWYYYAAAALVIGIAIASVFVFRGINKQFSVKDGETITAGADGASATGAMAGLGSTNDLGTADEYAAQQVPRFPSMPWSARVLDGRQVTSDPRVYCMSSLAGEGAQGHLEPSVTCLTDQGTRYEMPVADGIRIARHGMPYNHYRSNANPAGQGMQSSLETSSQERPRPLGASLSSSQVNGYGDIGIVNRPGP